MNDRTVCTPRAVAVWAAATVAAAGLTAWLVSVLADGRGEVTASEPPFDRLLVLLCAGAALLAVAWLWLLTTAVVVEALRGRADTIPGVPAPLRRAVLAACGVAVVVGLTVPAHSAPTHAPGERREHAPQTAADVIAGLPLPDRAAALPAPAPEVVEVRPGDTLWDLARRDLGPGADDAAITARWHEIYAINRTVIGADPDLIQPAQRLRLPVR